MSPSGSVSGPRSYSIDISGHQPLATPPYPVRLSYVCPSQPVELTTWLATRSQSTSCIRPAVPDIYMRQSAFPSGFDPVARRVVDHVCPPAASRANFRLMPNAFTAEIGRLCTYAVLKYDESLPRYADITVSRCGPRFQRCSRTFDHREQLHLVATPSACRCVRCNRHPRYAKREGNYEYACCVMHPCHVSHKKNASCFCPNVIRIHCTIHSDNCSGLSLVFFFRWAGRTNSGQTTVPGALPYSASTPR